MKIRGPTFHRRFFFIASVDTSLVNDGNISLTTGREEKLGGVRSGQDLVVVNTAHKTNLFFKYRAFTYSFILDSNQHLPLTLSLPTALFHQLSGQVKTSRWHCFVRRQKLRYV